MDEYIDKNLAMQAFENAMPDGDIFDAINQLSTVNVVRCEFCKHWQRSKRYTDYGSCDRDALMRNENFFCAAGKRREVQDG